MKTFKDLVFNPHPNPFACGTQAKLDFDNGYSISVIFGHYFYSNGIDTYEIGILKNGILCYDTPITDDVIGYVDAEEVTNIMKQIQELPSVIDPSMN